MANPYYTILRTAKLLASELSQVESHNDRTQPTPNADITMMDGVRVLRCTGNSASDAVGKRIANAGAKPPSRNCYVAVEVVLSLSPNAPSAPSDEVFSGRSLAFLDAEFGTENVVAVWLHRDEKTPHVHALVVPISEGQPRGRPTAGAATKTVPLVSWNRFSGSEKRIVRKDGRAPVEGRNLTMEQWQTNWANVWLDHGYRRGIPSKRPSIPMKAVQAQTGAIQAMADIAKGQFISEIESLQVDLFNDNLISTLTTIRLRHT